MKFTKSSWFVTGFVAGAIAIAGVVLFINDGTLSPKMAQAESQERIQHQSDWRALKLLSNINNVCKKIDAQVSPPASGDASESALASDLRTMRSQIELYKVQHLDKLPSGNIVDQLTKKTNISGGVYGDKGASGPFSYGPYLQKIPANPFTEKSSVETGTGKGGGGNAGWYYNTRSGKFCADDDEHKGL